MDYSLEGPNLELDFMILPRQTQDRYEQIPCMGALEKEQQLLLLDNKTFM
jgi:hypothetical protein